MKTKNISFAEVLRKNSKSPRVEVSKSGARLEDLMRRFDLNPDEDFTLYLDHCNASHRSKLPSFQMTFSRNAADNQDEIFDSWIQKQSAVGSNKENIRNQPQRSARNEPPKKTEGGFKKIITHSKAKQEAYPINSARSQNQRDSKAIAESQHQFIPLNIEMIKSNGYQSEVGRCKSPKTEPKFQPQPVNLQPEKPKINVFEKPTQIKVEPTFKEIKESKDTQKFRNQFSKQTQRSNDFTSFPREQPNQSFQTRRVEQQISDITSKYLNANYSPEGEASAEDEELLLDNSPPSIHQQACFNEEYSKKAQQNDDIMKKRMENAKNMIGNYLDKFKKERQQELQQKKNDIFLVNPHFQQAPQQNTSNHMVGYSFSTNFMGVNQSAHNQSPANQQNYITDVVSEVPDEAEQPLNESAFNNKYLNLKSFEAVEQNEHIPNIQSVKYYGEEHNYQNNFEYERLYGVPNNTFKAQLITSKQAENPKIDEKYTSNTIKNDLASLKEEPIKNFGSYESNHLQVDGVNTKGVTKSRQKISLISSKSKLEKSNKASPSVTNKPQKTVQVATTDFTIESHKQETNPPTCPQTHPADKSFQQTNRNEIKFTYMDRMEDKYACAMKTETDTKLKSFSDNYGIGSGIYKKQAQITKLSPEHKIEEASSSQYLAPTYAKTTSRLTEIASDYYSTTNYTPYTPSYEPTNKVEPPTYAQSKFAFTSSKTNDNLPLKAQTPYTYEPPKETFKKENSYALPITNSYEQKYALPTSYASNTDREVKKNILEKLDIKESITLEETKTKQEQASIPIKNSFSSNYTSLLTNNAKEFKTVNPVTNPKASLKLSLKQSINVSESDEFIFDL